MNFSAWFNGVQQISQTIASLPIYVYKKISEEKKEKFKSLPLFYVLSKKTNIRTSAYTWSETTINHAINWGNAYSYIERDRSYRVVGLWLMNPRNIQKIKVNNDGTLTYLYRDNNRVKEFLQDEILHIPGLGFDGIQGYSVLSLAKEAIGLGLSMEKFNNKFYESGTSIGGILTHPGKLSVEAKHKLKKQLKGEYGGAVNAYKTMVLSEGMTYEKLGMPLEDAQFLQSREFQIQEIARWLNMPPHKLKDLSHATYSNIEQEQASYYQDTIRPWLERMEAVMNIKLLPDPINTFIECDFKAILRADMKTRYESYNIGRMGGWLSANAILGMENMNPIDEEYADAHMIPLNMVNAKSLTEEPEPMEEPKQIEEDKSENKEEDKEEKSLIIPIEQRLIVNNLETRAAKSIVIRRNITDSYRDLFKKTLQRIVNKEIKDIRSMTNNYDFKDELLTLMNDYYRKFPDYFVKNYKPAIYSFADEIVRAAKEEVKASDIDTSKLIDNYMDTTTVRYVSSSQSQLAKIIRNSQLDEINNNIDQRLSEWEEKRADKVTNHELIDGENGFAQFIFFASGFNSMWVSVGKSCPYCNTLDGRIISEGGYYITKGESIQPEDKEPMNFNSNISHPSAHQGCDCSIIPV